MASPDPSYRITFAMVSWSASLTNFASIIITVQDAAKSSPLKFFAVFSATVWNFGVYMCVCVFKVLTDLMYCFP